MDKATAIREAEERRKRNYDDSFSMSVSLALKDIEDYSKRLQNAKAVLKEMKYEPPEDVKID